MCLFFFSKFVLWDFDVTYLNEEVIVSTLGLSLILTSLGPIELSRVTFCHHKKSFSAAPSSSLITWVCMRRHSCSEKCSGRLEETRGRACSSTPTPSLPSTSQPQPRARHQRQVEWNHEITGKVSITLWNQALSKSRQDPASPWN